MFEQSSDEDLLASGDARQFALLYERRHPLVREYLHRRLGRRSDLVFDLVAETFARALERRDQFDRDRGSAVSWLLGIAQNLMFDAIRRGQVADRSRRRMGFERILVLDEQLERIERSSGSDLGTMLSTLPADQQEAIRARIIEQESYAEIAQRIGCSQQVLRKRVSRGLATLKRVAKENGT